MAYRKEDVFVEGESLGERVWGEEILIYNSSQRYSFKVLHIKQGCKGGLQYHRKKDECTYMVSGEMIVRYDLGDGNGLQEVTIGPGDWIRFPPGMVHQEEAITDVVRIEASTPFFNDRVRVEELYGLEKGEGLPTTSESEILER